MPHIYIYPFGVLRLLTFICHKWTWTNLLSKSASFLWDVWAKNWWKSSIHLMFSKHKQFISYISPYLTTICRRTHYTYAAKFTHMQSPQYWRSRNELDCPKQTGYGLFTQIDLRSAKKYTHLNYTTQTWSFRHTQLHIYMSLKITHHFLHTFPLPITQF